MPDDPSPTPPLEHPTLDRRSVSAGGAIAARVADPQPRVESDPVAGER